MMQDQPTDQQMTLFCRGALIMILVNHLRRNMLSCGVSSSSFKFVGSINSCAARMRNVESRLTKKSLRSFHMSNCKNHAGSARPLGVVEPEDDKFVIR